MTYLGRGTAAGEVLAWNGNNWAVNRAVGSVGGAGRALARPHDTTHSPAGLWQLNESLSDDSGNGLTLSVAGGSENYTNLLPGVVGFYADNEANYLRRPSNDSVLTILGDLTVEFIARIDNVTGNSELVNFAVNSETEANNNLYAVSLSSTSGFMAYGHEHGAGVNDSYALSDSWPRGTVFHAAVTRVSNVITFYLNGAQIGASSSTLTGPSGGSTSFLNIGSFGATATTGFDGAIGSVKIIASGLDSGDVRDEYNRTLGPVYGIRDGEVTTSLGADVNDWNPSRFEFAQVLRVDGGGADRTITGLFSDSASPLLLQRVIVNVGGSNDLILTNEDSSSTDVNRIVIAGGSSLTLEPGAVATVTYDLTSQRWRIT